MNENPYQTPQEISAPEQVLVDPGDKEAIRREYISHEASIKTIGLLYYIGGILVSLALLAIPFRSGILGVPEIILLLLVVAVGGFQIFVGYHLRKFQNWARIVAIVLSFLSLLSFPVGTIISIFFLIALFSKKNEMVFSPFYKEVIAATPHVKYKVSKVVWIVLGILVLVVAGSVVFFISISR